MLNNFGVAVAAASGVGLKVGTFAGMPCWAIGQTVTAMVGQNIGANNIERVKKTTKVGLHLNIIITLIVVIFIQIFAKQIIILFDHGSLEVVESGILYLRICCGINTLMYAAMYTLDSFAIGIGAANIAMVNSLLDAVIVRLADREEMEIVNVYEDAAKSGKSIDGRPAFKQMLCDIENG